MLKILKKTYPYYGKIYGILILCTILGFVQSVLSLVEPQIISLILDSVITPALGGEANANSSIFYSLIENRDPSDLWGTLWILIGLLGGFMVFYFITFYAHWNIAHYFSIRCDNRLRSDVLRKIHSFGTKLLKEYNTGDLITMINSDAQNLRNFYVGTIPFMAESVFYIILAFYFLSRLNPILMLIPFLTIGMFIFITKGMLKLFHDLYNEIWKKNAELNSETNESIYGIRTIKACGREDVRQRRFNEKSEQVRDISTMFGIRRARYYMAFDTADQIVMLISMAVSIWLASNFLMTSGEYSAFLIYLLHICGNFIDLIFYAADLQDEKVSAERMFGLLDRENPILDKYGERTVSKKPHILLSHLTVYTELNGSTGPKDSADSNDATESKNALEAKNSVKSEKKMLVQDVSLDIPYGKKLGIMGRTGSGKSVLLKVLQAFREYQEGEFTIDGIPSHEYDRGEITRAYSYAMQDVFLFSHSIAANIAYYRPEATDEEVEHFGQIACVEDFAKEMPDGYQTLIGEKGFGLSGGQKQRVAIARALLKDAPVIVLDDCTSALDMDTESKIFANLADHCEEKTLIMATHRAVALKDFDEIIFMDDGKIIERGSFEELMALNGAYAAIYRQQMDTEVYVVE